MTFKDIRKSKGVSIAFVSRLLGISESSVRNKESGRCEFTLSEARALAKLYSVSLDEVVL